MREKGLSPDKLGEELVRFVDSAVDRAIFLTDSDGVILSWPPGGELLTGWQAAQIIGQPLSILYAPQDARAGLPAKELAEALARGTRREEGWRIRRDGSEFLADVSIFAIRGDGGAARAFALSVIDVTSRKAAEQALVNSESHVRSILATIPEAMIVIDERGIILSFSAAAERLFGFDEAEVLGRNVSMLMPAPDAAKHDSYIGHYLTTSERRIIGIGRIVVGKRRDGSEFPMELAVGEARSDGYRIFTGFIRDLTSAQRAEFRLKELQSELIHVSRVSAMGTMASTLAHELNQPLTAIANYLEAARDLIDRGDAESIAHVREAVDESAKEALRAGGIVRRLRDFVARGEVEKKAEDLPRLIEEASHLALTGARERGVRAFFALDPAAACVIVDRIQIQQVLVNLVRNAVEALSDCEERDISISTECLPNAMVRISVEDTGHGIEPAVLDKLFQAFTSTKEQGMGLGLSICRTIVEAHGGRIWAEPRAGGGTIFHFTVMNAQCEDQNDR